MVKMIYIAIDFGEIELCPAVGWNANAWLHYFSSYETFLRSFHQDSNLRVMVF